MLTDTTVLMALGCGSSARLAGPWMKPGGRTAILPGSLSDDKERYLDPKSAFVDFGFTLDPPQAVVRLHRTRVKGGSGRSYFTRRTSVRA